MQLKVKIPTIKSILVRSFFCTCLITCCHVALANDASQQDTASAEKTSNVSSITKEEKQASQNHKSEKVKEVTHEDLSNKADVKNSQPAPLLDPNVEPNLIEETTFPWGILSFIITISLVLGFFLYKRSNNTKTILRQQYSRFEYVIATKRINLFRRHHSDFQSSILVKDIISSEVLLNDEVINSVTVDNKDFFYCTSESYLRRCFSAEHRFKMVDGKERSIRLIITDTSNEQYPIFLYYRKGNQRLTRDSYELVIEHLIDWHWQLSQILHPSLTPKRIIPSNTAQVSANLVTKSKNGTNVEKAKVDDKTRDKTTVQEVSTASTNEKQTLPEKMKQTQDNTSTNVNETETETETETKKTTAQQSMQPEQEKQTSTQQSNTLSEPLPSSIKHEVQKQALAQKQSSTDTALVNALEKIVKLKQEGFLSDNEFQQAKQKLLSDLAK